MIIEHKKYDLFGETVLQKIYVKTPYQFTIPVSDHACFLYSLEGEIKYSFDDELVDVANKQAVFLNCLSSSKEIIAPETSQKTLIVVVNFHPEVLQKIYNKEIPQLLQNPKNKLSIQSAERINNDFLIQKYIESLLFYFDNPLLTNEEILTLKLKEIIFRANRFVH